MGIDYHKWDYLDEYSSSDEDEREKVLATLKLKALATDDSRPKGLLLTVPWDTHCEAVRWALDRHGISYVEENYPWGLHIWGTLAFSDPMPKPQQTHVPVFRTGKGDVLKRSSTDIFMYLFAHSLSTTIRLYTPHSALDLQTKFDEILAPAARIIFLNVVLNNSHLARKYLIDTVHLNTWRTLCVLTWPVMAFLMKWWFQPNRKATLERAWDTVTEVFAEVDAELEKQSESTPRGKVPYLCGSTITAADITFACHSAQVLFPNSRVDTFASKLGILVPSLDELPTEVAERVRHFRSTRAGKHAIRMYRKERGENFRTRSSKYSKENNPWWAEEGRLNGIVWGLITIIVGTLALIIRVCNIWEGAIVTGGIIGATAAIIGMRLRGTVWEERAKQACFMCFNKPQGTKASQPKAGGVSNEGATIDRRIGADTATAFAPSRGDINNKGHAM